MVALLNKREGAKANLARKPICKVRGMSENSLSFKIHFEEHKDSFAGRIQLAVLLPSAIGFLFIPSGHICPQFELDGCASSTSFPH